MSQARTARRRRKQAAQGYNHLAPQQRPIYRPKYRSLVESITAEKRKAERMAAAARKKK